ncbi:histidine phosphatase family protein [Vibrio nigripulchritudo]|uniref:histidine phosphatase family protein n=1 Tax=Vibrio nigripulchritudo TaxID=28173 RepID=UPI0012D3A309|nr:histidine phosphatase family protein [Vibrio nigripulchritudo]
MRIVIMRHGRPELDLDALKKQKFSSLKLGEIVEQYEQSALEKSQTIPHSSLAISQSCQFALSSDLPRAIGSIEKLGMKEIHETDAVFRESPLPYFNWSWPFLSFFTWAVALRVLWLFGFATNGESIKTARARAQTGAGKLHQYATEHRSVFLLGHGIMNRLIAKELSSKGWKKVESNGENYWSYSVYERL